MSDHVRMFCAGLIVGAIGMILVLLPLAIEGQHCDAIRHGAGHYDPITGRFQWNDAKPEKAQ